MKLKLKLTQPVTSLIAEARTVGWPELQASMCSNVAKATNKTKQALPLFNMCSHFRSGCSICYKVSIRSFFLSYKSLAHAIAGLLHQQVSGRTKQPYRGNI